MNLLIIFTEKTPIKNITIDIIAPFNNPKYLINWKVESGINSIIDIDIITLSEKLKQKEMTSSTLFIFKYTIKPPITVDNPAIDDIINGIITFIIDYISINENYYQTANYWYIILYILYI